MDFRRDVEVLRHGPVTDANLKFATSVPELAAVS